MAHLVFPKSKRSPYVTSMRSPHTLNTCRCQWKRTNYAFVNSLSRSNGTNRMQWIDKLYFQYSINKLEWFCVLKNYRIEPRALMTFCWNITSDYNNNGTNFGNMPILRTHTHTHKKNDSQVFRKILNDKWWKWQRGGQSAVLYEFAAARIFQATLAISSCSQQKLANDCTRLRPYYEHIWCWLLSAVLWLVQNKLIYSRCNKLHKFLLTQHKRWYILCMRCAYPTSKKKKQNKTKCMRQSKSTNEPRPSICINNTHVNIVTMINCTVITYDDDDDNKNKNKDAYI